MQKSSTFFVRMFTVFLARVRPASSRAKPGCMKKTRKAATSTQTKFAGAVGSASSVAFPEGSAASTGEASKSPRAVSRSPCA